MYTIRKRFTFSASHQLFDLEPDHPCMRLHGHNYRVEIVLRASILLGCGFVLDYRKLDLFKKYLDENIDHRDLNSLGIVKCTTAEYLAKYFFHWCYDRWPETVMVRVSETEKTWAEFELDEL